jgi:ferric-dicitrate binding protein FerR (iron transport regulator)
MKKERTTILIFGSLFGQLSTSEQAELQQWLDASPENVALLNRFEREQIMEALVVHRNIDTSSGLIKLKDAIRNAKPRKIPLFRFSIAASIFFVIGVALYYLLTPAQLKNTPILQTTPADVALIKIDTFPQLRLSNGSTINLDSTSDTIVELDDLIIRRTGRNELEYSHTNPNPHTHSDILYNTIIIPGGKPWKLITPDASTIWVNVQTVFSYPIITGEFDRVVSLRGEGYFNVAKATWNGKSIPYTVNAEGCEINVTGTRFNVNSYSSDSIKTVLLEGTVSVTSKGQRAKIKPGQAAVFEKTKNALKKQNVDTSNVTRWISGSMIFPDDPLSHVFDVIERVHGVQITVHENFIMTTRSVKLIGEINAEMPLDKLLLTLGAMYNFDYKITGKQVYIIGKKDK